MSGNGDRGAVAGAASVRGAEAGAPGGAAAPGAPAAEPGGKEPGDKEAGGKGAGGKGAGVAEAGRTDAGCAGAGLADAGGAAAERADVGHMDTGRGAGGHLAIVGLGPGGPEHRTPAAEAALASCEDVLGYGPYVARVAARPGLVVHPTDNREELSRARHALALAASGRRVAVVSSGDAGVFAMASAVFEAIEHGEPGWRALDVEVVPGVSAMLAAASRVGAPLGHDFCVLSLSDNLKPWDLVLRRLRAAAEAGFALALYNPVSRARPWQLGAAFDLLREVLPGAVPVVFVTAATRPEERVVLARLELADAMEADMRTLVLVGSAETRVVGRAGGGAWVYSPRSAG